MNPLLLGALASFAPALLSKLGAFGPDPQAELRKKLAKLLSPEALQALTAQNYQANLGSPAYSQAQGAIAQGANLAGSNLAANLGARGIGATGTGAVLSSLTPSLVGSQTAQLRTQAHTSAQQAAMEQIRRQIEALTGTAGPSQGMQLFGGGLEAFAPLLQAWINSKYPALGKAA